MVSRTNFFEELWIHEQPSECFVVHWVTTDRATKGKRREFEIVMRESFWVLLLSAAGAWLFHCHIELHAPWGMETVFFVHEGNAYNQRLLSPPMDCPVCWEWVSNPFVYWFKIIVNLYCMFSVSMMLHQLHVSSTDPETQYCSTCWLGANQTHLCST